MHGQIRCKVSPTNSGASIRALRKTKSGDVLMELRSGTTRKSQFGEALHSTLGDSATFLKPNATVELRDLGYLTTAVDTTLQKNRGTKFFVCKANSRGQRIATVTLTVGGL